MILIAGYFFIGIAGGMYLSLTFIFADAYLGLGAKLPLIFMSSLMIGTLSLGVWYRLANHLGKKFVWGLSTLFYIAGLVGIGLLTPGEASFIPLLLLKSLIYIGLVASGVVMPSLLADIIDYGTLKSGNVSSASYFSIHVFLIKITAAVGGAMGLALAGWYGFDATVTVHSGDTLFGLYLGAVYLPIVFLLIKLFLITLIPINARRHDIIRRRLDSRRQRTEDRAQKRQLPIPEATVSMNPQSAFVSAKE